MKKIIKKIIVVVFATAIMLTQNASYTMNIQAQEPQATQTDITDKDAYSKTLKPALQDSTITTVDLYLDNVLLQSITLSKEDAFTIYRNGTYYIEGKNSEGHVQATKEVVVDTFSNVALEKNADGKTLTILSRFKDTKNIQVSGAVEATLDVTPTNYGSKATFEPTVNGTYTFTVINQNKEALHEGIPYEETSFATRDAQGRIEISTSEDIAKIAANVSGNFVLTSDIEIVDDALANVTFRGTLDANGYVLSGVENQLFQEINNATIKNLTLRSGALAAKSTQSTIEDSGFYMEANNVEENYALLLESDQTTIKNSYVLANIEGKEVAGFVLNGEANIEKSYISGYLKGEESVYGFGKDTTVKNSYSSASVRGETTVLFSDKEQEANFYDVQQNTIIDEKATALTQEEMISGTMKNEAFQETAGYYPQIKAIDTMKEKAKEISLLSVQALVTNTNLAAIDGDMSFQKEEKINWEGSSAQVQGSSVNLQEEQGEVVAKQDEMMNRFALQVAQTITSPVVGEATTQTTTQITYPTTNLKYYIIKKVGETAPDATNHKEAITNGWKIVYWTGVARETGLEWNTDYVVYETDLTTQSQQAVKTEQGISTGKITLDGTYEEGQTLTATLSDYQEKTTGTLYWEKAETLDATTWSEIKSETISDLTINSTYEVVNSDEQSYIRVRFVIDANFAYKGEHTAATSNVLRSEISSVTIHKSGTPDTYNVGDKLSATITPENKDNEVVYTWYRDSETTSFYTGINYTLNGSDIGKQIKVVATAKDNTSLKGEATSGLTGEVAAIKNEAPTILPKIKSFDDSTAVVTMEDSNNALYQFKIINIDASEEREYDVYARSNTDVSIIGLVANTNYQILARTIGEDGYLDSDYSATGAVFTTSKQRVQGSVELKGSPIYGKDLTASVISSNSSMTGTWEWYRIASNGTKTLLTTTIDPEKYTIVEEDINSQIEAVYVGTDAYAGEISSKTDVIVKAESGIPTDNATLDTNKTTYNSVTLTMPTNDEGRRYIVGYSATPTGVPIEYQEGGKVVDYEKGTDNEIKGLKKDTKYYFFVRYKESTTNQKSEWVDAKKEVFETTKKKTLEGNVEFTYATEKGKPMKGEELRATIKTDDSEFNYNGEWKWYKIESGSPTEIFDFSIARDKKSSVYNIPSDAQEGTTYKVTYTPTVGYDGSEEKISEAVIPFEKQPYATPLTDDITINVKSDTTLSIMMNNGEGQYQFRYKKSDEVGYKEITQIAYKYIEVEVNELLRNRDYVVSVKRVGDDDRNGSEWSSDTQAITTLKTGLSGYVSITGTALNKGTLKAEYITASYSPVGDDSGGSWQWYRGDAVISGANSDTYVVGDSDVEQILTAKYTAKESSDFAGSVLAKAPKIEKAISEKPTAIIVNGYDKTNYQLYIDAQITKSNAEQKVFYRLQKAAESAPVYPTTPADWTYWNEVTSDSNKITQDGGGVAFEANGAYTMYMLKTEGEYIKSSGIVSTSFKMGTPVQTGKVTMSGKYIVNETITATLSNENNSKGTWKWYMSKDIQSSNAGTMPDVSEPELWTEITSGFIGAVNSKTSELKVTVDMWGHYLRAEFVANEDEGYNGSLSGAGSNSATEKEYVRRVFEETLKIESSSKDGNGNPKAYSGTTVTATIENSYESVADNNSRTKYVIAGTAKAYAYLTSASTTNSIYRYTFTNDSSKDGVIMSAQITGLSRFYLYVDKTQKDYSNSNSVVLNSPTSTGTSFQYISGTPITSEADLRNFIERSGSTYSNRGSGTKFVITNNIKATTAYAYSKVYFSGVLDGDYHTITGMQNPLFYYMVGSTSHNATVKNLILYNASIYTQPGSNAYENSGATISRTGRDITLENVFLAQSYLQSQHDTGYFLGKVAGGITIKNCGSAGGTVTTSNHGTSLGGMIGSLSKDGSPGEMGISNGPNKIINSFSIDTQIVAPGHSTTNGGGSIGAGNFNMDYNSSYFASKIGNASNKGALHAIGTTSGRAYYDNTKLTGLSVTTSAEVGMSTGNMIGDGLKSQGSNNFNPTAWTFKTGSYPQLNWLKDHPISNLYAATRASFVSTSGYTNQEEKLKGWIYSTLIIPEEFRTKDYTITSSNSNVLKVVNNSVIVPVGASGQSAIITITYNEPDSTIGGSAKNTFTFIVQKTIPQLSVSISGTPQSGKTLTANASGGNGTAFEYQWYRRKSGESVSTKITEFSKSNTYTLTTADIGYEFAVEAKSVAHSETMSTYSSVVTAPTPTSGPTLVSKTDSEVKFKQTGLSGVNYDIAYTVGSDTTKILLPTTYADGTEITLPNLQRNKEYKIYARVTAGSTYSASAWSPALSVTTDQTDVVGSIIMGPNINNGQDLSFTIENTNNQTGTWKLERLPAKSESPAVLISDLAPTTNTFNYTLKPEDVGYRIRATYTGRDDFKGEIVGDISRVVNRSIAAKPNPVTQVPTPDKDYSLTIKAGVSGEKYDIGIASTSSGTPTIFSEKAEGDTEIEIPDLKRNTTYYVYARGSETDAWVVGPWSDAAILTTGKTAVQGAITVSDGVKVDEQVIFTAPETNGQVGRWTLERKASNNNVSTISPLAYTVSGDTRSLTYKIQPQDASEGSVTNTLHATFHGTENYSGSIDEVSSSLLKAKLSTDGLDTVTVENTNTKDQSLSVKATSGKEMYQFGYAESGKPTITDVASAVNANTEVIIGNLARNTTYDIYIRKAAKLGYEASDYVKTTITAKTLQTQINGTVSFTVSDDNNIPVEKNKVGSAIIGYTYTAEYHKGTYHPDDDDSGGTWEWYADGSLIANETNNYYTVPAMGKTVEFTVKYTANADSNFTSSRETSIGTLEKAETEAPTAPTVTALTEDGNLGSQLKIVTDADKLVDVYWYVQKASNETVPQTIAQVEVLDQDVAVDKWFKAAEEVTIPVEAYTGYVVYVAKLENNTNVSSGVISQRSVVSAKDNLERLNGVTLKEANPGAKWKILQDKAIQVDCEKAVTGTWDYYVVDSPNADKTSWQNINLEIQSSFKEGVEAGKTFSSVQIPLKYREKYVIAVFTGRGAYEGTLTYRASAKIEGTLMKGIAELEANYPAKTFDTIKVTYKMLDGNNVDNDNGRWYWYRETDQGSGIFEQIMGQSVDGKTQPIGKVGLQDEYTLTASDVNKQIYAEYTAQVDTDFSGFVKTKVLGAVERKDQEQPDAPVLKQVNGTNIQVTLPNNYDKTKGTTIPEVVLGYRKASEPTSEITWQEDKLGDSWIKNLNAQVEYEVYARYEATSEYKQSIASNPVTIKTGNQIFDEGKLILDAPDVLEPGNQIVATFEGKGYDEGHFVVKRSDGVEVNADTIALQGNQLEDVVEVEGRILQRDVNQTSKMTYTCVSSDIGANLIIIFEADEGAAHYGGSIAKASTTVQKPKNPNSASAQALAMITYEEAKLTSQVSSDYEYALNTSADAIVDESNWQKLTATASEMYTFENLDKKMTYYLHARLAETDAYRHGEEVVSAGTKPWNSTLYAVTYTGLEGVDADSPVNPSQYTELDEVTLNKPKKKGYTFLGWTYEGQASPQPEVTITLKSSGEKAFHANWTINQYLVTFESNGGSTVNNIDVDYNAFVPEPVAPTKTGYTFIGWYKDAGLMQPWIFSQDKISDSAMTLYAKWEINTYSATFDGTGGSSPSVIRQTYDVAWGTMEDSVRDGYTFLGWYDAITDGNKVDENTVVPANDVTYYAHWSIIDYSITYELNGGVNNSSNPITYNFESDEITLQEPTKNGCIFQGWVYEGQSIPEKNVVIPKGSFGEKKYTAMWEVTVFTINYDLGEGTNNTDNPPTYTVDSETITLKAPRKEGYAFTGWTYGEGTIPTKTVVIEKGSIGEKSYTAHWEIANVSVSFETQGGNDVADIGVVIGDLLDEPETPTREGYTFAGWYKEVGYQNNWDFANDKVEVALTLYAKWTIDAYTISFDAQNGSNPTTSNKKYGETLGSLTTPSKSGYIFDGWYTQAIDGTRVLETTIVKEAQTYYAHYQVESYNITYNLDDGVNPISNPNIYTIESETITLMNPTKEGNVFEGWTYTGQTSPIKPLVITKGSVGDLEVTANWAAKAHTITFVSNGGTAVSPAYATEGGKIERPSDPVRKGYVFEGWYKEADYQNMWKFESDTVTADITLSAKWAVNPITVAFDTTGGTEVSIITKPYGSQIGTLPVTTKEGYTFSGWYPQVDGGSAITERTIIDDAITYYAQWKVIEYPLTYQMNDGENNENNPSSYTIEDKVILQQPRKANNAFVGWTYDGQSTPVKEVTIAQGSMTSYTFVAHWKEADLKVSFESNGGSKIKPIEVANGETIGVIETPSKTGAIFKGWYIDNTCTTAFDPTTDVVSKDMTLYAKWEVQSLRIQFDAVGGDLVADQDKAYGSKLGSLPTTTKAGYTFEGWYTEVTGGQAITEHTIVENERTYYARWKLETYTISYDLQDGTNNPKNPSDYTIEDETITLQAPRKTSHVFVGWTYKGHASPTLDVSITKGSMKNMMFTANWNASDASVSFNTQGGSSVDKMGAKQGDLLVRPEEPTKEGYTFSGWYKETECTNLWNFTSDKVTEASMTLYAGWNKNDYRISFDSTKGSAVSNVMRPYESKLGTLSEPRKAGYTFEGWYTEISGGQKVSEDTIVKNDMTLYAKWKINQYKITYNMQSGTNADNPTSYTVEDTIRLAYPKRTEYVFLGWTYTGQTTPIKDLTITQGTMGDQSYIANWQEKAYTVSYDSKGGSSVETYDALSNDPLPRVEEPVKAGYTFKGWFKEDTYVTPWNYESDVIKQNWTLYAKWEANTYTATFNGNGGSDGGSIEKECDEKLGTLPESTRIGYTFVGWYTKASGGTKISETTTMPAEGATYYAHWTINKYTATFNGNGGSNGTDITVDYDSVLGTLPTSTKTGYTFVGWFTQATGGTQIDATTKMPLDGATYFAHWTINQYTATFNGNGGSNGTDIIADYNSTLGTLPTSTRVGYTFDGWYTKASGGTKVSETTTVPANNVTYYAHWTINQYTATFNGNGGSNGTDITVDYDSKLGTLPTSTRDGYTFVGWFSEATGGTQIDATVKMPLDGATYYAQWTINQYTATFNGNGGSNGTDITADYNSKLGSLPISTRVGYTFDGWFSEATGGTQIDATVKMPLDGATYYAHWTINQYTATFNGNGGSNGTDITVDYDSVLGTLPTSTRDGYTFVGWFSEATGGTQIDATVKMPLDGATYYAQWKQNPTPTPTPTPDPVPTPNPVEPAKEEQEAEEKVVLSNTPTNTSEKESVSIGKGSVDITLDTKAEVKDKDAFIKAVLTPEQLERVENGETIEIRLSVEEKQATDISKRSEIEQKAKENGLTIGCYYDVSISINENSEWKIVRQLNGMIQIILQIPEELQALSNEFYALREHDGVVELLNDKDTDKTTVTIETDSFSIYAIGYKANEEESTMMPWMIGGILIVLGGGAYFFLKSRKEDEE